MRVRNRCAGVGLCGFILGCEALFMDDSCTRSNGGMTRYVVIIMGSVGQQKKQGRQNKILAFFEFYSPEPY